MAVEQGAHCIGLHPGLRGPGPVTVAHSAPCSHKLPDPGEAAQKPGVLSEEVIIGLLAQTSESQSHGHAGLVPSKDSRLLGN